MIRIPTEDTVLSLPNPVGEQGSKPLPVSKGQRVSSYAVSGRLHPLC
jgi:hypothetical protein